MRRQRRPQHEPVAFEFVTIFEFETQAVDVEWPAVYAASELAQQARVHADTLVAECECALPLPCLCAALRCVHPTELDPRRPVNSNAFF